MKQLIFLIFPLNMGTTMAQNLLLLPKNASPGMEYWQEIEYDSIHRKKDTREIIPAYGWEAYALETMPKHQRFTLELPVFDTIILKIPVDRSTHMANLPDEYGLITERTVIEEGALGWDKVKKYKNLCLPAKIENCIYLVHFEIPPEYLKIQKLVLKSTAHQQYFENLDTLEFKRIVEVKPLVKMAFEVPPQYKTIFKRKNPYAAYSEWRPMICAVCGKSDYTVLKIQKVLKKRGYYHGRLDDIMGEQTKAAIMAFQKVHNFEIGSLNRQTIDALNIEDEE